MAHTQHGRRGTLALNYVGLEWVHVNSPGTLSARRDDRTSLTAREAEKYTSCALEEAVQGGLVGSQLSLPLLRDWT